MDSDMMRSFREEAQKIASAAQNTKAVGGLLSKIRPKDVGLVGIGAAGLYGTQRLYQDVKAGEQMRKQQRRGY
jgi:hypothetical protein